MTTATGDVSLKCALLAVGDFPEGGATSQRIGLLSRLLGEALGECDVWLLHATSKTPIPENSVTGGEIRGVRFSYLSGRTVRPPGISGALIDTVKGIARSVSLLVRPGQRPDILILYTPRLLKFIVPLLVAKTLRIPLITEICEVYSFSTDVEGKGVIRRIINSGDSFLEWLLPRVSCGLLVISERIRKYYKAKGMADDDIYLLPVLADFDLLNSQDNNAVVSLQNTSYLLNSGSFNEKDGLEYLVKAVARVRSDHPEIRLVFTGHAAVDVRERICGFAGEGDCGWIVFTGYLTREQLIWCYRHSMGLLSCRSNSDYANYGFPTKLAEYLASGRPVVATTVGDVNNYLVDGETAFLAEPENTESIADAIRRLAANPEFAGSVGQRGKEIANRYFNYKNHVNAVGSFIRHKTGQQSRKA